MSSEGLVGIRELIPLGGNISMASYGSDKGLWVEFSNEPIEQTFLSEQQGRKIYKDVPHIRITTPGNKSDLFRPVILERRGDVPSDPERFPKQWAAFKNSQEQVTEGMPLEHWAQLSKAEVLEWKACKVHTVEQIAALADSAQQNFPMNFRKVRDAAKAWLGTAAGDQKIVSAIRAENETLKADVADLKRQIAELAAAQTKRGPGRPRKDEGDSNAD